MKVYVIVSMDGGIPHVEAVLRTEEAANFYFDELLETMGGIWEDEDNPQCFRYAVAPDLDADLRLYERNLL